MYKRILLPLAGSALIGSPLHSIRGGPSKNKARRDMFTSPSEDHCTAKQSQEQNLGFGRFLQRFRQRSWHDHLVNYKQRNLNTQSARLSGTVMTQGGV
jgi:hypothetical protein